MRTWAAILNSAPRIPPVFVPFMLGTCTSLSKVRYVFLHICLGGRLNASFPGVIPPFLFEEGNSGRPSVRFNYSNAYGMPSGGWSRRGDWGFGLFGTAGRTGLGGGAGVVGWEMRGWVGLCGYGRGVTW